MYVESVCKWDELCHLKSSQFPLCFYPCVCVCECDNSLVCISSLSSTWSTSSSIQFSLWFSNCNFLSELTQHAALHSGAKSMGTNTICVCFFYALKVVHLSSHIEDYICMVSKVLFKFCSNSFLIHYFFWEHTFFNSHFVSIFYMHF